MRFLSLHVGQAPLQSAQHCSVQCLGLMSRARTLAACSFTSCVTASPPQSLLLLVHQLVIITERWQNL